MIPEAHTLFLALIEVMFHNDTAGIVPDSVPDRIRQFVGGAVNLDEVGGQGRFSVAQAIHRKVHNPDFPILRSDVLHDCHLQALLLGPDHWEDERHEEADEEDAEQEDDNESLAEADADADEEEALQVDDGDEDGPGGLEDENGGEAKREEGTDDEEAEQEERNGFDDGTKRRPRSMIKKHYQPRLTRRILLKPSKSWSWPCTA